MTSKHRDPIVSVYFPYGDSETVYMGSPLGGSHIKTVDLPEWVQRKVAVLRMVDNNSTVAGVGLRLNEWAFHLYTTGGDE